MPSENNDAQNQTRNQAPEKNDGRKIYVISKRLMPIVLLRLPIFF